MTRVPILSQPRPTRGPFLRGGVVLLALAAACATTSSGTPVPMREPSGPAPQGVALTALGELVFSGGRSAAYDGYRVAGPRVNIAYSGNGTWAGDIEGRTVMVTAEAGKIKGPGGTLYVSQEGDQLTIRGMWFQRSVSLQVSPRALKGRTGEMGPSFDFTRTAVNVMAGDTGVGRAGIELRGEAQQVPNVTMPQFVLALLAALP